MNKNQKEKNYCWRKYGKNHPAYGHTVSDSGIIRLQQKGIAQGISNRNKLPKVIEINLNNYTYNIYSNPNSFLEKTFLDWNKVKFVLQRNTKYVEANKFPRIIKPTYQHFWCAYSIYNLNLNQYIEIVKEEVKRHKQKKLFDELWNQEKSLINQLIRFPITAQEALDDFYHNNLFFLINKQKTKAEKRKLFINLLVF
jgi:hypothetical protein